MNGLVDAAGDKGHNRGSFSEDDIRLRAYRKWESEGKPTEAGIRIWLEAEKELQQPVH